jgi:hypothetical protein
VTVPIRKQYRVRAEAWLYPGPGGWHFITLPKQQSEEIREIFGTDSRAWGAQPVEATLGETTWKTSLFADSKSGCYLLPLKAEVRRREHVVLGNTVVVTIRIGIE